MTEIGTLGMRVRELVAATASTMGPVTPPQVDLTSNAYQDLKADTDLGDPATLRHPVRDMLGHLELLFHAMNDHMSAFGRLLDGESPSWFGHIAVARAAMETSSRVWLITEPDIGALERVYRHLLERQYEMEHQSQLYSKSGPYSTMPADVLDAGRDHLAASRTSMLSWAKTHGLETPAGRLMGRIGPTDLMVEIFEADTSADKTDQPAVLGAYHYNRLSAVAHGLPSGVSIYHRPPTAGQQHGHNVLTPADIGHVALAVLTVYDAGYDRLARYFRWPHAEILPLRWAVSNQILKMVDSEID